MPDKVVCVGLNYLDHIEEQHIERPDRPLLFAKFPASVIADGEPIVRPAGHPRLDLEAELGVVIGKRASRVKAADAMGHVAGYVVGNDVSRPRLAGGQGRRSTRASTATASGSGRRARTPSTRSARCS